MSLDGKLAKKRFAFKDVPFILDAAAKKQYQAAQETVNRAAATVESVRESAGDGGGDSRLTSNPVRDAEQQLEAARAEFERVQNELDASLILIRVYAVPFGKWNSYIVRHPARKGMQEAFNPTTIYEDYARKEGVYVDDDGSEVDVSTAQWDEIFAASTDADHTRLALAIVELNKDDATRGIDFTLSGSGRIPVSSETPVPHASTGSPSAD